jgi:hypothetical protein
MSAQTQVAFADSPKRPKLRRKTCESKWREPAVKPLLAQRVGAFLHAITIRMHRYDIDSSGRRHLEINI